MKKNEALRDFLMLYTALQGTVYVHGERQNLRSLEPDSLAMPVVRAQQFAGMPLRDDLSFPEPDLDDNGIANIVGRINSLTTSSSS